MTYFIRFKYCSKGDPIRTEYEQSTFVYFDKPQDYGIELLNKIFIHKVQVFIDNTTLDHGGTYKVTEIVSISKL